MTLWQIDIFPEDGYPDPAAAAVAADAADLGIAFGLAVSTARGFLLEGDLDSDQVTCAAQEVLSDPIVERTAVGAVGDAQLSRVPPGRASLVYVLPKPGVMDPVAQSTLSTLADLKFPVRAVRTFRKYFIGQLSAAQRCLLSSKVLANESIEQVVQGPLQIDRLEFGTPYTFALVRVPLSSCSDADLERLSRSGQLYLSHAEMRTIQDHFRQQGREPTDIELETVAQTWSEHCSHKTLRGCIRYRDEHGERQFENLLKETIFAATSQVRASLGDDDWCVSVFEDNAGVVRFDDRHHVVFKVETHNHPSAIEPYGGANTGLGGVIRDPLGTGLGARPVCNTDVFCFADPRTPAEHVPPGVLHPRRVLRGVVSGVRDYGNRMGIPTVNGAVYFDPRYMANPLVYCGNVGLLPCDRTRKQPQVGDWIVGVGGRTGRDGIHGATFSSAELTTHSESISGGAVQIGNAITEKMLMDVLLAARDHGLYHAITDCGAGGFSSAVGEMAASIGAEVWLDKAPLKYEGLSYAEIWISEAQERMVVAVPPESWSAFERLCRSEDVEATILGRFVPSGRLRLLYHGTQVADLSMEFLHHGRPKVVRDAVYRPVAECAIAGDWHAESYTPDLLAILGSLNVASKEWIVRQYDHEVQAGSCIKPLVGARDDGPSDAAVVRPVLDSWRGLVVACGMNPRYGELDPYHMAASAIDEAVRNCVAVGSDPGRIAILDNFCWGQTDRPETLGSLVRAALGCHDVAVALGTPFISGKDSLNNEFHFTDANGTTQRLAIPPSLLISALGQVDDVRQCVTMDLKGPGNLLFQVGVTRDELGGSHFLSVRRATGGQVPQVYAAEARMLFRRLHGAVRQGLVRACHDVSEGGLAVAVAEMAIGGRLGAHLALTHVPHATTNSDPTTLEPILLFSESNTRFVCEVRPDDRAAFEQAMEGIPIGCLGSVSGDGQLIVTGLASSRPGQALVDTAVDDLVLAWKEPLAHP